MEFCIFINQIMTYENQLNIPRNAVYVFFFFNVLLNTEQNILLYLIVNEGSVHIA